jgi:hypothetical protein
MNSLFDEYGISFDENDNATISKEKLCSIIKQNKSKDTFCDFQSFPAECYVLVDRNSKDFYFFPPDELEEWETDGSCGNGDALYEMKLLKKY